MIITRFAPLPSLHRLAVVCAVALGAASAAHAAEAPAAPVATGSATAQAGAGAGGTTGAAAPGTAKAGTYSVSAKEWAASAAAAGTSAQAAKPSAEGAASAQATPAVASAPANAGNGVEFHDVPDAKVEQIVQEDDKVRIEETRVRGLTQKLVIKRKDGTPEYEILLGDTGKDIPVRQGADRGGAGQRVWRVLSF
ncbi:hypothetical protein [Roseateles terrae]|uniref:PepSY domain-containing protein n=1 Tax=Roseateles terrae TaxID=431060 RepID=A0ABR6GY48_9BURK|nr:hypothetical protein [Roseateles terrae]MBB3196199.1 hypothetical protein [Roseateles terrae]OWQ84036.1 hypothetical protein CDN98_21430 [Roseateles terrae]